MNSIRTEIVFLGDVVHAPRPCRPERQWIEETLMALAERMRLDSCPGQSRPRVCPRVWPFADRTGEHLGNRSFHRAPRRSFRFSDSGRPPAGHWAHPSFADDKGCGRCTAEASAVPCSPVVHCAARFFPFAGGYDVSRGLRPPIADLFRNETVQAVAVSGKRALPLGPLNRVLERMDEADLSAPAQFRGFRRRRILWALIRNFREAKGRAIKREDWPAAGFPGNLCRSAKSCRDSNGIADRTAT